MAKITTFRGLRYNQKRIRQLASVVTPPYDVISQKMQSEFYKANSHNFIRIILGKENTSDNKLNNKYSRAASFFKKWSNRGIFIQEKMPSVYIYEQAFKFEKKHLSRIGFVALLKLEPAGKGIVFPHEKTFCKPKEDRLKLLKAIEANLSPLFGLYSDRRFTIDTLLKANSRIKPLMDLRFEGVEHRLWGVSDERFVRRLKKLMLHKKIFIADGHHRYEVACFYNQLMKKSKRVKSGYVMMYFCNIDSEGLKVLPTHRAVRYLPKKIKNNIFLLLNRYFTIQGPIGAKKLFPMLKQAKKGQHLFGLYPGNNKFYLLKLKAAESGGAYKSGYYNNLDVVLLHNLILGKLLGVKEQKENDKNILHTRDERLAIGLVNSRKYRAAFFMNPPKPAQIRAIARVFKKMPHKSTYFYPKPLSGLVINSLKVKPESGYF